MDTKKIIADVKEKLNKDNVHKLITNLGERQRENSKKREELTKKLDKKIIDMGYTLIDPSKKDKLKKECDILIKEIMKLKAEFEVRFAEYMSKTHRYLSM